MTEASTERDRCPIGIKPAAASEPQETPHAFLRRETRRWHEAVEEAFAGFDLCTRAGLAAFLRAQASAVWPLEEALATEDMRKLLPDWALRLRSDALRADLEALGSPGQVELAPWPLLDTVALQLGAFYVLEGSRLGGRLLARRVAASSDPTVALATRFLRHTAGPGAWAGFLEVLDRPGRDRDGLLEGAGRAFHLFESAARRFGV